MIVAMGSFSWEMWQQDATQKQRIGEMFPVQEVASLKVKIVGVLQRRGLSYQRDQKVIVRKLLLDFRMGCAFSGVQNFLFFTFFGGQRDLISCKMVLDIMEGQKRHGCSTVCNTKAAAKAAAAATKQQQKPHKQQQIVQTAAQRAPNSSTNMKKHQQKQHKHEKQHKQQQKQHKQHKQQRKTANAAADTRGPRRWGPQRSLCALSGRLLVEFRWCLKCWGPPKCTFGVLWVTVCEPRLPGLVGPLGFHIIRRTLVRPTGVLRTGLRRRGGVRGRCEKMKNIAQKSKYQKGEIIKKTKKKRKTKQKSFVFFLFSHLYTTFFVRNDFQIVVIFVMFLDFCQHFLFVSRKFFCIPETSLCIAKKVFVSPKKVFLYPQKSFFVSPTKFLCPPKSFFVSPKKVAPLSIRRLLVEGSNGSRALFAQSVKVCHATRIVWKKRVKPNIQRDRITRRWRVA